jgi:hypothetical protein
MIQIVLHRILSLVIACSDGMQWERGDTSHGWRDKSADCRRADMAVGEGDLKRRTKSPASAFAKISEESIAPEPSLALNSWRLL